MSVGPDRGGAEARRRGAALPACIGLALAIGCAAAADGAAPPPPRALLGAHKDLACGSCHEAPGEGSPPRRSADRVEALCATCHGKFVEAVRDAEHRHAPIDTPGCTGCHDPHGTDYPHLLGSEVLAGEWNSAPAPPHIDLTRLCWRCHDRRLALEERTETMTGFRHDSRNLHTVHVALKKPRGCDACHDPHASDQEFHIRPGVPFGSAGSKLPITYRRTDSGGSCIVGCHGPASYSRE